MKAEPLNSFCKYCKGKLIEKIEKKDGSHIHCYEAMDPKSELYERDYALIKEIETKISRNLPVLYHIEMIPFDGLVFEHGRVVCLGIMNLGKLSIPEEIFDLDAIRFLSFSVGNGQRISDSIKKLVNLERLVITHLKLDEFPNVEGHLPNLRELKLWSNSLEIIPEEISRLKQLRKLNLNSNNISILPDQFGNLTNLVELSLESNNIRSIPEKVCEGLVNLRRLYLAANAIRYIPEEIKYTKLEYLDLAIQVDLEEVPKGVFGLECLRILNLATKDLKRIPKEIINLTNLEELYVDGHVEIPKEMNKLKKLKQKIIEYNRPIQGNTWKKSYMLFDLESYESRNQSGLMNIANEKNLCKYVRKYSETMYFLMPNGYYYVELGRGEIAESYYVVENAIDNISYVLEKNHDYWSLIDHYPDRMDDSFDEFKFDLVKDLENYEKIVKEAKNLPEKATKNKKALIEYLWSNSHSEKNKFLGIHYF